MIEDINLILEEHESIERELLEIEEILDCEIINYPNFIHVWKKLVVMWDNHEMKEVILFEDLARKDFKIPIETLFFEHGSLEEIRNKITESINSGSEFKLRETLENYGRKLLKDLREHMGVEDEILYRIDEDLLE